MGTDSRAPGWNPSDADTRPSISVGGCMSAVPDARRAARVARCRAPARDERRVNGPRPIHHRSLYLSSPPRLICRESGTTLARLSPLRLSHELARERGNMLQGSSRRGRRTGRASHARRILIVLALCGLAGAAGGGAATAAAPAPGSFARVCSDPAPGELACFALRRTTGVLPSIPPDLSPAATVGGFGPPDLAAAYRLPTNLGSGRTVAIVDAYNDPNAESDLATYRAQFGLPAC